MRINKKDTQEHAHALACEQAHELVFCLAFFSCYSRLMLQPGGSEQKRAPLLASLVPLLTVLALRACKHATYILPYTLHKKGCFEPF